MAAASGAGGSLHTVTVVGLSGESDESSMMINDFTQTGPLMHKYIQYPNKHRTLQVPVQHPAGRFDVPFQLASHTLRIQLKYNPNIFIFALVYRQKSTKSTES